MSKDFEELFIEGETYQNLKTGDAFMVMAVDIINDEEAWIAVLYVNEFNEMLDVGEIRIDAKDYGNWELRNIQ